MDDKTFFEILQEQGGVAPFKHSHTEKDIVDLDRIRWRGKFVKGEEYKVNDLVSFNDSLYICITDNKDTLPTSSFFELVIKFEVKVQQKIDFIGGGGTGGPGGGTTDHAALTNLDFVSSGHTGFLPDTHLTDFAHADIAHANRTALDLVSGVNTGDQDLSGYALIGANVSIFTNDAGYLTAETDPIFTASAAYGITTFDIINWNTAYGWGDHSSAGYLKTETDPIFTTWLSATPPIYPIIDITYADLVTAIGASTLVKGQLYRITDYQTKHKIPNTTAINTGAVEPLIVLATDTDTISSMAYSQDYPEDIIYYDYSNDTCEDGSTPRNGYITFRHDTKKDLSAYYDIRACKWRRYHPVIAAWDISSTYAVGSIVYYGSTCYFAVSNVTVAGTDPATDFYHWIPFYDNDGLDTVHYLYIGALFGSSDSYTDYLTFNGTCGKIHLGSGSIDNVFLANATYVEMGAYSIGNTFRGDLLYTVIGDYSGWNILCKNCEGNTIGSNCINNSFFDGCKNNFLDVGTNSNLFSSDCIGNRLYSSSGGYFSAGCSFNEIILSDDNIFLPAASSNCLNASSANYVSITNSCLNDSSSNIILDGCHLIELSGSDNNSIEDSGSDIKIIEADSNTIGSNSHGIVIGKDSDSNIIGDGCNDIKIGSSSASNTIGDGCYSIIIGNSSSSNIFQSVSNNITVGDNSSSNLLRTLVHDIWFGTNCSSNIIGNLGTYIHLDNGCSNNTFGIAGKDIFFTSNCSNNTLGNGVNNITFLGQVTNLTIDTINNTTVNAGIFDFQFDDFTSATLLLSTTQKVVFMTSAPLWVGGTSYIVGDRTLDATDNGIYECNTPTSDTTEPSANANWTYIGTGIRLSYYDATDNLVVTNVTD